jgi:hypothetical protein
MTDSAKDAASVIELLTRYSFDLSGYTVDRVVDYWLQRYPSHWVRLGVIEALYQGRYKAVSVEQILILWRRRGKPVCHFNPDFERVVTPRFVRGVAVTPDLVVITPLTPEPPEPLMAELPMEKPPQPPRLPGAIQPFSVGNMPLPREARFRDFGAPEPAAQPESEVIPDHLESPIADEAPEAEPAVDFPEPPRIEFQPSPDRPEESAIPPFQPIAAEQNLPELEEGRSTPIGHQPIHQFVPMPEPSEFYTKLKAIIQNAAAAKSVKNSEGRDKPGDAKERND